MCEGVPAIPCPRSGRPSDGINSVSRTGPSDSGEFQATNKTKEQFANSPDLNTELANAIMSALDAHTLMSTQALNSPTVQSNLKEILLKYARLWESLREKAAS